MPLLKFCLYLDQQNSFSLEVQISLQVMVMAYSKGFEFNQLTSTLISFMVCLTSEVNTKGCKYFGLFNVDLN